MNNNFLPYQIKKTNDSNESLASQLAEKATQHGIDITQAPYNIDPTGSVDTSSTIQSIFNNLKNGDVIYIPYGTYLINSPLTLSSKNNVTIYGQGNLKFGNSLIYTGITFTDCSNLIINGITLDGNNKVCIGVEFNRCVNLNLQDTTFQNFTDDYTTITPITTTACVRLSDGVNYATIFNNTFQNCQAKHNDLSAGGVGDANSSVGILIVPRADGTGYYPNPTKHFLITGNRFNNISPPDPSVPVSGKMPSNADGIKISTPLNTGGTLPYSVNVNGQIIGNRFYNCNKRSVKIFADGVVVAQNQSFLVNNGSAYAGVSCYGNDITVRDNYFEADANSYYYACLDLTAQKNIKVINNLFNQQSIAKNSLNMCVNIAASIVAPSNFSENNIIKDNTFYNSGRGLNTADSIIIEKLTFSNNYFENIATNVLNFGRTTAFIDCNFSGNKCYQVGQYFLSCFGTSTTSWHNVVFENNAYQVGFQTFANTSFDFTQTDIRLINNWTIDYTLKDFNGFYVHYKNIDYYEGQAKKSANALTSTGIKDTFTGKSWNVGDRIQKSVVNQGDPTEWVCVTAGIINSQPWQPSTTFSSVSGNFYVNSNGNVYMCTTGGLSGTTPLSGTGSGIVDNQCRWTYQGTLAKFIPVSYAPIQGQQDLLITTNTTTNLVTFNATTKKSFVARVFYRVTNATTNVTLSVSYTNGSGTTQTDYFVNNTSQAVGEYTVQDIFFTAQPGNVTIDATMGTANNVYVSAILEARS